MVPSSSSSGFELKETLSVLWKNKWFILLVTALCTTLGLLYANYSKPLYKAEAILMPPLASNVVAFNETDLKLFTSKNIFAIFTSALTSENAKYDFFKKNILPFQATASISDYKLYKSFFKKFKVDSIPGTNYYKITFTSTNPLIITKEIKKYIDYANQLALYEVISISKKEHEKSASLIQQKINLARESSRAKTKSQLVVLAEALEIATSSGIEKPIADKALLVTDKTLLNSLNSDPSHLYHNGTKPLKALINNLSKRTNHDAFIPDLDLMIKLHDFYQTYQLMPRKNILYHLDGIEVPAASISFSKTEMIVTSLLLGLLLSIIMILAQYIVFKNKE